MKRHTRIALLAGISLAMTMQISAQSFKILMKTPREMIESKWELNSNGDQQLNYYNRDFCDYYVFRQQDRSYSLRPGKNTIFTIHKGSNADNPFKSPSSYMYFRGNFVENFNIKRPYALPVKDGTETSWTTDKREPVRTLNFQLAQGDTVYAVRSGVACRTPNPRILLVYHADCTFAAYLVMDRNFIEAGQEVQVGQPVGVAGITGVSISFFFLDENKFENLQPTGYPYSHFMPVFRTAEGDVQLEEQKVYKAVVDDAIIMQDMSKRQQKKYLKNKRG